MEDESKKLEFWNKCVKSVPLDSFTIGGVRAAMENTIPGANLDYSNKDKNTLNNRNVLTPILPSLFLSAFNWESAPNRPA